MCPYYTTDLGELFQDDCLEVLPTLPAKSYDLIFADPPFNLDKEYGSGISDKMRDNDYLAWCRSWITECVRLLAPGGSIWLYNLPRWNIELGHELNRHGLLFRHWVAIDLKMSLPIAGRLYPSHYSLIYYTDGKPRVFNRPRVPVPVCRHCGGDIKDYGGHRGKLHPDGLNLADVWRISRQCVIAEPRRERQTNSARSCWSVCSRSEQNPEIVCLTPSAEAELPTRSPSAYTATGPVSSLATANRSCAGCAART